MLSITFEYANAEIEVEYSYQPEEKQTLEHTGCAGGYDIEEIYYKGQNITMFCIEAEIVEDIEKIFRSEIKKEMEEREETMMLNRAGL